MYRLAGALIIAWFVAPSLFAQTSAPVNSQTNQCDIKLALGTPGISDTSVPPPSRIRIMPSRYAQLEATVRGYEEFHIPLLKVGRVVGPAGAIDDVGGYYLIPQLATRLRMPLTRSIDVFYITVLIIAFGLGALGCCLTLQTGIAKMWAIVELVLIAVVAYRIGDVYIVLAAVVIAIVPLALFVSKIPSAAITAPFMFGSGLAISAANAVRGQSGTGVLIFLLCLLATRFVGSTYRKVALLLPLAFGLLLPNLYLTRLVNQRDVFLRSVCPEYPPIMASHALWHSVYIGFGYLTNNVVPGYNDQVGYEKVQSLVPGTLYGSAEYQKILRQQVWMLVRQQPQLVLYTIAAKFGVIGLILLLSGNVGLICAIFGRKPAALDVAFWLGMGFNALFGIAVVPLPSYLLGFIAFAVLYGIVSFDFALQNDWTRSIQEFTCTYNLRATDAKAADTAAINMSTSQTASD